MWQVNLDEPDVYRSPATSTTQRVVVIETLQRNAGYG